MRPPALAWLSSALLLGAGCPDRWTAEDALRPGLEFLDEDGSGDLSQHELQRGSPIAVNIQNYDKDGSGAVDLPELLDMLHSTDPVLFDGVVAGVQPSPEDGQLIFPAPHKVRTIRVLFRFMATQIQCADPRLGVPSDHRIQQAALTGSLNSYESRQIATELVGHYTTLNLPIPPSVGAQVLTPGL